MFPASAGRRGLRLCLVALAVAATAIPLFTLRRFPTPFPDVELYASIARARQIYGVGIPTIIWNSPVAVDHVPFYGPVFFDLSALALAVAGVHVWSVRLVSVIGAALFVLGTGLLARQFTTSRDRTLLAVALALTAPEVNFGLAAGSMNMLTIGFEVLALAVFVKDLDRGRRGLVRGMAAGALLGLAALTTPRSYPFIGAFLLAGLLAPMLATSGRVIRDRTIAALLALFTWMCAWAVVSHGSVTAWVRYMVYIFLHEDSDVAVLPTAERILAFHWSGILTPAAVILFGVLAAWSLRRRNGALTFLAVCGWINLVASAAVLNYTFTNVEFIALPLFAVVVSWPWDAYKAPRWTIATAIVILLAAQTSIVAGRYALLTVTWAAHDPEPLNAFVERFVPAGSAVVGPDAPYFFAVERTGSRLHTVSPRSPADWARWVPILEPASTQLAGRFPVSVPRDRFLIWPVEDDVPENYRCALGSLVATYEAPRPGAWWPTWIARAAERYPGYPSTRLYRLVPGCPSGYDPTRPR